MDYREMVAAAAQQVINKGVDYSQIHVARLESGWSLAYRQEPSNFVADQWFPMIGVQQIAGLYPKWAMENAFTNKAGTWRPGTIPPQGELAMDTPGSYVCQRYAFEMTLAQDLPCLTSLVVKYRYESRSQFLFPSPSRPKVLQSMRHAQHQSFTRGG